MMTRRISLLIILCAAIITIADAQRYRVLSITGRVTVETAGGQTRELRLREVLTPQSRVHLPYAARVELFDEGGEKKHTLRVPGSGSLATLLADRQNSVIKLTGQYLSYIKDRLKGSGEMTSRRFSDPATVTREVAVKKRSFRDEFNRFSQQARSEYAAFRREAIASYGRFMRQAWKEFGARPAVPRPVERDVPPVIAEPTVTEPVVKEQPIDSAEIEEKIVVVVKDEEEAVPAPTVEPQPQPVAPIEEKHETVAEYVDFSFYQTPMRVRFNRNEVFSIDTLDEGGVAAAYEQLARRDFNNTILDCLELRANHRLGDWAYLQMLDSLARQCYASRNEATLLMACLYQQSGYQMRLGLSDDRLLMLYATRHRLFGVGYYAIGDGCDFYVYGDDPDRLRICEAVFPNERPLSLYINEQMLLAEAPGSEREIASRRYPAMKFSVSVNKNLIDFYDSYPTSMIPDDVMTRWAMYANTPLEEGVSSTLVAEMGRQLEGCSETDALSQILNWVQTGFVYEYDDKVWGGDRAFFAEESLYYPYCDCEDRGILFSRLVRDLLGLKVMLVYYPGHIATAVRLGQASVTGDYISYNGERYIVCDPTYIGAPIGSTMPSMDNKTAKIVLLEN